MDDTTIEESYDPLSGDFEAFIKSILAESLTPGLAVAVVHGSKTWSAGYGVADLDTQEPVTPHTLFFTGSTTKSFIAALASKLVCSDKPVYKDIGWSTRLADLIGEDFVLQDQYATKHVTLKDALSHRTGMPRHDRIWINGDASLKGMVRNMRHIPLHNEIRTTYEYCNLMFSAVAYAIENITSRSCKSLLHSWLWQPLGMTETLYSITDAQTLVDKSRGRINLARGYLYDSEVKSHVKVQWSSLPPSTGAGGVISNVLDYAKWINLFIHPESPSHNPDSTLAPSAVADMSTPHIHVGSTAPYTGGGFYGLGLTTGVYRSHKVVEHGGAIGGYMAHMIWLPDLDWGCVVMHNSYTPAYKPVSWRLIDDFLGTPDEERYNAARDVHRFLDDLVQKGRCARERLYPSAPKPGEPVVLPALTLELYEGVYHHPAYSDFTISLNFPDQHPASSPRVNRGESETQTPKIQPLYAAPSATSYLDCSVTLHHVNGEYWVFHSQAGPKSVFDEFAKLKFEIDVNGKVSGIRLQAETAMEEMAWFEKVE